MTFRIQFKTKDGSLMMDREGDPECWLRYYGKPWQELDKEFAELSMGADARRKGLKILSYKYSTEGINALVDYL